MSQIGVLHRVLLVVRLHEGVRLRVQVGVQIQTMNQEWGMNFPEGSPFLIHSSVVFGLDQTWS